jgi:hypothetical protein
MRKIMKKYSLTAKELHFGFKNKHKKTPDEWNKMKRDLQEDNKKAKDEEGYMAKVELEIIDNSVDKLKKAIKKSDQQLPAWIQSKITRAADYIDSASEYLTSSETVEEDIVSKVLKSLFEDSDCECDKEIKPVKSVKAIAKKHGVSTSEIEDQLKMGIKVESEHTKEENLAKEIALQHLDERPDYYTKLKKVETVKTESTILNKILDENKKSKKMKDDPCWKGYEMVGTKKKGGKEVPNCVPVSEATLPVQNGHVMYILISWRGKMLTTQLFFPQIRVPNRKEITDAIVKVYPEAKIVTYRIADQNVGQPLIQVPNSRSKNYLLNNKTIGEETEYLEEDGPSLSVGRGEKLPVSRGGGLTAKGREKYNRETGSNLQAPVTGKVKRGSKAWKRRKNFCSRSRSWTGPRGKAARRRWKC